VTRFGPAEEHALRPHGRGELPLGRRRGRWRPDRGRRGDHARGRPRRPQRCRGQRVGFPPRGSLGGPPGPGARVLLAVGHPAVGHPAGQPDDEPRDRGRDLPAAIGGPGGRDPACRGHCDSQHLHLASPGPARPAVRGVARLAALAQVTALAVAVGPVPPPPPPPPPLIAVPDSLSKSWAGAAPALGCRTPSDALPDARRPAGRPPPCRTLAGRTGTGLPLRQNALDPGFHGVPAGPAHPDRDADGADVT
jgi:hypothetical protein